MKKLVMLTLLLVLGGAGGAYGACTGGTPPAAAAAVGYTCRTFYDDFSSLSTIDTTNAKTDPTKKWYPGQNWPLAASANWPNTGRPFAPATWYSIGAGGLTLLPLADEGLAQIILMSCAPTAAAPNWIGNAFTGGFFLRTVQSVSGSSGSAAWPVVWTATLEFFLQTTTGTGYWVENDHLETSGAIGSTASRYIHYWKYVNGTDTINDYISNSLALPTASATADSLLVPASRNGGTAKLDWFVNGTVEHVLANAAGWTGTSHADVWDLYANNHSCILLGSGSGAPMVISLVEVWQAPDGFPGSRRLFR